jgi:hypothetical protein
MDIHERIAIAPFLFPGCHGEDIVSLYSEQEHNKVYAVVKDNALTLLVGEDYRHGGRKWNEIYNVKCEAGYILAKDIIPALHLKTAQQDNLRNVRKKLRFYSYHEEVPVNPRPVLYKLYFSNNVLTYEKKNNFAWKNHELDWSKGNSVEALVRKIGCTFNPSGIPELSNRVRLGSYFLADESIDVEVIAHNFITDRLLESTVVDMFGEYWGCCKRYGIHPRTQLLTLRQILDFYKNSDGKVCFHPYTSFRNVADNCSMVLHDQITRGVEPTNNLKQRLDAQAKEISILKEMLKSQMSLSSK